MTQSQTQMHPAIRDAANDNPVGAVVAPLTYTIKKPEKLAYTITPVGENVETPDYSDWYAVHDMTIHDVRGVLSTLSLDNEGFVLRRAQTAVEDFYDQAQVEKVYNLEVEQLIMDTTGANRVVVFDHTIRVESDDLRRQRQVRKTVPVVHNDYTVNSGPQRLRDLLGEDEAARHAATRFAIFNLWRSIAGTVQSSPLALCDARSLKPEDFVPVDLIHTDRRGEIYNVAFNPDHRWCYVPNMASDEVLIFKCYDSAEDGRARFTPHTAFTDATSPADAPPRQSMETRVLAFFDEAP